MEFRALAMEVARVPAAGEEMETAEKGEAAMEEETEPAGREAAAGMEAVTTGTAATVAATDRWLRSSLDRSRWYAALCAGTLLQFTPVVAIRCCASNAPVYASNPLARIYQCQCSMPPA
jgi:hypothetical protein